jgi:hypothetical protein
MFCFTYSGLEFSDLPLAFSGGECLSLLESDGDFSDFDLELFAEGFGVLVVLLFLSKFLGESVHFSLQSISTFLSSAAAVESIVKVGLHGSNISFHTAFVVCEGSDLNGDFGQADSYVVEFILSVLAASLGLFIKREDKVIYLIKN